MSSQPYNGDNRAIRSVFEAGCKLEARPQTTATAATIFHKFFKECSYEDYDPYLIAATAMYLAGKVEEDHLKIRDIINVFYKIIHRDSEPLALGEEYWSLRDSIVCCELLLMRILKFKVSFDHPHRYLLHFLKSIYDWLDPKMVAQIPIARTCWALLCDYYQSPACLIHQPQHVAVAIIELALQCHGVTVPCSEDAVLSWQEALCEDLTKEKMWEIMEDLMKVYDKE